MMAGKQMSVTMVHNGMALQSGRRARKGLLAAAVSLFAPAAGVRSRLRQARASLEEAAARVCVEPVVKRSEPSPAEDA